MTPIINFLPYILPSVPGCTDILAEQTLRDICIDFCSKSLIVQKELDPVSTFAGIADYDFATPTDMVVFMVMQAWFKDQILSVVTPDDDVAAATYNTRFAGAKPMTGNVNQILHRTRDNFTLIGIPDVSSAAAITMRVALIPTRTADTVADLLFNDYAYEIGQGVIARLMRIPSQKFTNPQLSGLSELIYTGARNAAQIRANRMYGRSSKQVEIPRFQ